MIYLYIYFIFIYNNETYNTSIKRSFADMSILQNASGENNLKGLTLKVYTTEENKTVNTECHSQFII